MKFIAHRMKSAAALVLPEYPEPMRDVEVISQLSPGLHRSKTAGLAELEALVSSINEFWFTPTSLRRLN
jgi:hypothetical protein